MSRDNVSGILDVESPFDHGLYKISPGAEDAQKTIVLADSSKFRRRGFSKIANITDIDTIITDSNIPPTISQAIEDLGIELKIIDIKNTAPGIDSQI